MAPPFNWNDNFTDEDVYRSFFDDDGNPDEGPTLAEMFWNAFYERARVVQMIVPNLPPLIPAFWRPALNIFRLGAPPGSRQTPLNETAATTWPVAKHWDDVYQLGSKPDDPANGIYPDPLLVGHLATDIPSPTAYIYDTAGILPRFSWQRLLFHTWQLRAFYFDPEPYFEDEQIFFHSPSERAPWPGDEGFTRKYYREINRLDADGADGEVARFVILNPNLHIFGHSDSADITRPFSIAFATPTNQYQYAGKIFKRINGSWKSWDQMLADGDTAEPEPKQPDRIIDHGFPRGGDIFGPWILNEIRDGLNEMTATGVPSFSKAGVEQIRSFFLDWRGPDPDRPGDPPLRFGTTLEVTGVPFGFEPPGTFNDSDGINRAVDFYYWNGASPVVYQKATAPPADRWNLVHTDYAFENAPIAAIARWDVPGGFKYTKNT